MKKCLDGLQKLHKEVRFRALYIEKDRRAYDKLEPFLNEQSFHGIETHALKGEFINLRSDILHWCGDKDFTFFFIDPKGWKQAVEIPTLRPLLERSHSEFSINFMYDFLLRTHTQEAFSGDIKAIFGEGPDASAVINGRLISVSWDADNSIFAFSAVSFSLWRAILSCLRSMPCSFLNSPIIHSIILRSKSSPPRKVLPFVDFTSVTPSPISSIDISKVPPPRS